MEFPPRETFQQFTIYLCFHNIHQSYTLLHNYTTIKERKIVKQKTQTKQVISRLMPFACKNWHSTLKFSAHRPRFISPKPTVDTGAQHHLNAAQR